MLIVSDGCRFQRVYTYVEEDVLVRLEDGEMRVGFAMSGGADEQQTSLINNILPGERKPRGVGAWSRRRRSVVSAG